MFDELDPLLGREDANPADCACDPDTEAEDTLRLDASGCPGRGRLEHAPACRATAVDAADGRSRRAVRTSTAGVVRTYEGRGVALLTAAGRFAEIAEVHDERLAERARRDPLGAAAAAAGRSGHTSRAAAETGLLAAAEDVPDYHAALGPLVGPAVSRSLVARAPPADAVLAERYELETGAVVRVYERTDGEEVPRRYHVEPPVVRLDTGTLERLAAARERLAEDAESPAAAVGATFDGAGTTEDSEADSDTGLTMLTRTLEKHTRGAGVLADLFADTAVSDVFATSPVTETPLRVRRGDETMTTNVRLTVPGAASLAGRFRRESGRSFSRADPTLAATTTVADRRVRVGGVTDPVTEGHAFAFRAHDREAWRLVDLVANGTVPPPVAGLLSLAVERGVACLVTGERGAGKTTLLGALLWELPATTRTVLVEDTPELPAAALQGAGRDVQSLRVGEGDGAGSAPSAAEALRTALRLGESALVVGEVRGEEARVLYEAMRVGAGGAAVLGTIHGDGAATVRERLVTDLGVLTSSFADTDVLVTVGAREVERGRERRVRRVEEVTRTDDGDAAFATLYGGRDGLAATERLRGGESELLDGLRAPGESSADVLAAAAERGAALAAEAEVAS